MLCVSAFKRMDKNSKLCKSGMQMPSSFLGGGGMIRAPEYDLVSLLSACPFLSLLL